MEFLYMLLGFALYIGIGLLKTKRKHLGEKFSFKQYFKDELPTIGVAGLSATALMLLLPEIAELIHYDYVKYAKLLSVGIGVTNYSLFRGVMDIIIPKKFVKIEEIKVEE